MNQKRKPSRGKPSVLTKTENQAETLFTILFERHTMQNLQENTLDWLNKFPPDSQVYKIFYSLPELLEEYHLLDFFKPGFVLKGFEKSKSAPRVAAMFALMIYLIDACWALFGEKIYKKEINVFPIDEDNKLCLELKDTIKKVDYMVLITTFKEALLMVTGKRYYNMFFKWLSKQANPLDEPEPKFPEIKHEGLKKQSEAIISSMLLRCFLDGIYFYFGKRTKRNPKQTPLTIINKDL